MAYLRTAVYPYYIISHDCTDLTFEGLFLAIIKFHCYERSPFHSSTYLLRLDRVQSFFLITKNHSNHFGELRLRVPFHQMRFE